MSFSEYFDNIKDSVVSIFEGMAVTFSWMLRRPHTIQYPDRVEPGRPIVQQKFRGILEVDLNICTGCLACQRTCPIGVIMVEVSKGTERYITRFDIETSKCMYCGLCVEACPTGAIRHTEEFAFSTNDIRKMVLHFVKEPVRPHKPVKDAEPPAGLPVGSIVREMIGNRGEEYVQYTPPSLPDATNKTNKESS